MHSTYQRIHILAKLIVYVLYITISMVGIELGYEYLTMIIGTLIWFFGINVIAYILEMIFSLKHEHSMI